MQKDPALRPSSVRQVAATFPGGDPLAAALAAGETPSPEMVAASRETEGLRPMLIRFGLLAFVVQGFFDNLLESYPLTTRGSAWYAGISLTAILLMAAIALYGFYTSLGGRPVFGGAVLEE